MGNEEFVLLTSQASGDLLEVGAGLDINEVVYDPVDHSCLVNLPSFMQWLKVQSFQESSRTGFPVEIL